MNDDNGDHKMYSVIDVYKRTKEIGKTVETKVYEVLTLLYGISDSFAGDGIDAETVNSILDGYAGMIKVIYDYLYEFCGDEKQVYELKELYDTILQSDNSDRLSIIKSVDVEKIELIIDISISEKIRSFADKVTFFDWQNEEESIKKELYEKLIASDSTVKGFEEEISFMKKFDTIMVYPYDFILKYREEEIPVYFDDKKGMNYVLHKGKRLYFPYDNQDDVRYNYNQLLMEQDKDSPHAYFSDGFGVKADSVFLDVGGAEGMLSLEAIDLASDIYIFECDDAWKQALNNTFGGYDNVHIISKYVGRFTDDNTVTIDDVLEGFIDRDIYIKMDIEGMELDALKGACRTLLNNRCMAACTTYHTHEAYEELSAFFQNVGYRFRPSDRYMLFIYGLGVLWNGKYERIKEPYFRHGLIKAWI